MLSGITGFVNRHKRKLVVATGLAASGYFLVDYVKNKFFELQDRLALERTARDNLRRRFEQNQEDASFTIMALLPGLASQVLEKYPVERITEELKAKRSDRRLDRSTGSLDGSSSMSMSMSEELTEQHKEQGTDPEQQAQKAEDGQGITRAEQSAPTKDQGQSSLSLSQQNQDKTKNQLWKEIKIFSITRAITLVYASALLVFFTRLQLNILGRKDYVASVINLADRRRNQEGQQLDSAGVIGHGVRKESGIPKDIEQLALEEEELRINRMYLTFSWWLLNRGWMALSERVEAAVSDVFESVNPRTELSVAELSALIGQIQFRLDNPLVDSSEIPSLNDLVNTSGTAEGALNTVYDALRTSQVNPFKQNLLPPEELETYVLAQAPQEDGEDIKITPPLRRLLDESCDFIESPNAIDVVHRLVHAGLSVIVDKVFAIYPPESDAKVRLANILANVTKQAQAMAAGKPFEPNEYITAMTDVKELDGFSALVYSNYDAQ